MASIAEASHQQLQCPLCLDLLRQPVSTPCGHTFCKACLEMCWNRQLNFVPSCPMCRKDFYDRPALHVNYVLQDIVESFRMTSAPGENAGGHTIDATAIKVNIESRAEGDQVMCDLCLGTDRQRAVQSCLVCLTSYCREHLSGHSARFASHEMLGPVANMEDRMCPVHQCAVNLFCMKHDVMLCQFCATRRLKGTEHEVVTISEALKGLLPVVQTKLRLFRQATDKLNYVQRCEARVEREVHDMELHSSGLTGGSVQQMKNLYLTDVLRRLSELMSAVHARQPVNACQPSRQPSMGTITWSLTEAQTLLERGSSDDFCFIKNLLSIKVHLNRFAAPDSQDVKLCNSFMAAMDKQTYTFLEMEHATVKKCAVAVTFDKTTAHPSLIYLNKSRTIRVNHSKRNQRFCPCPQRFTNIPCILGSAPLCPRKLSYWEVTINVNPMADRHPLWLIGVATESATSLTPYDSLRPESGLWILECMNGEFTVCGTPVLGDRSLSTQRTFGICYNGRDRILCFYREDKTCIYMHTNVQAPGERLFPAFCPGKMFEDLNRITIH